MVSELQNLPDGNILRGQTAASPSRSGYLLFFNIKGNDYRLIVSD